jgi:Holliday junction resolvase RusA-like endonuclease
MISFFVPGVPKPGGSKTGFYNKKLNRVMIVDASKNRDWKAVIKDCALQTLKNVAPWTCPVILNVEFRMPRPKNHFGSGKNKDKIKDSSPPYPAGKPDCLKLARCLEDALTGILWRDDAQIVQEHIYKVYSPRPGAQVQVTVATPP